MPRSGGARPALVRPAGHSLAAAAHRSRSWACVPSRWLGQGLRPPPRKRTDPGPPEPASRPCTPAGGGECRRDDRGPGAGPRAPAEARRAAQRAGRRVGATEAPPVPGPRQLSDGAHPSPLSIWGGIGRHHEGAVPARPQRGRGLPTSAASAGSLHFYADPAHMRAASLPDRPFCLRFCGGESAPAAPPPTAPEASPGLERPHPLRALPRRRARCALVAWRRLTPARGAGGNAPTRRRASTPSCRSRTP